MSVRSSIKPQVFQSIIKITQPQVSLSKIFTYTSSTFLKGMRKLGNKSPFLSGFYYYVTDKFELIFNQINLLERRIFKQIYYLGIWLKSYFFKEIRDLINFLCYPFKYIILSFKKDILKIYCDILKFSSKIKSIALSFNEYEKINQIRELRLHDFVAAYSRVTEAGKCVANWILKNPIYTTIGVVWLAAAIAKTYYECNKEKDIKNTWISTTKIFIHSLIAVVPLSLMHVLRLGDNKLIRLDYLLLITTGSKLALNKIYTFSPIVEIFSNLVLGYLTFMTLWKLPYERYDGRKLKELEKKEINNEDFNKAHIAVLEQNEQLRKENTENLIKIKQHIAYYMCFTVYFIYITHRNDTLKKEVQQSKNIYDIIQKENNELKYKLLEIKNIKDENELLIDRNAQLMQENQRLTYELKWINYQALNQANR